ncbi:MAG TPA: hypothetical protein VGL91_18640 [Acidobacteriota bacterium]|jgi:hypothetical protein
MMSKSTARRYIFVFTAILFFALAVPSHDAAAGGKRSWAELVQSLSEPGGFFDSDNFVSNESSYLTIVPRMRELGIRGGVYIGVGPDQNFSYLTQIRPEQAIIIDIRRQNLLQHLLFKALMERARSRLEYLSLLFAKPVKLPSDLGKSLSAEQLVEAIDKVPGDPEVYRKNLEWVQSHIARKYRLSLSHQDWELLKYIYKNFYEEDLDIRYRSYGREFQWRYPTFRMLILERDVNHQLGNYMATEDDFLWLKRFQEEDRLVPVVGDLAGKVAMRNIARYLKDNRKLVRAFYVSNVEFYLIRNGVFEGYVDNVRALPVDDRSIFIRSYFGYGMPHPEQVQPYWMTSLMQYIRSFLQQQDISPYYSYRDLAVRDFISIKQEP